MTETATIAPPLRGVLSHWLRRQPLAPWLYLAPAAAALIVWIYAPLGYALWLSFHEWNMLPFASIRSVGTQNYERLLELPEMGQALRNTLVYLVGLLPLTVVLPVAAAILTHELKGRWRNIYRGLIFVPLIIAPVAAAAVWRWILDPDFGLLNTGLKALGLEPLRFLQDPDLTIWSIIWITGWKLIGFSTLIVSASLANINPSLIEAARMDGASEWQVTRRIRLPLLSPVIFLLILLTILLGAQWSFTYIHVLTQGGPLGTSNNIYYLLWQFGFGGLAAGWASAAGIILFAGFGLVAVALLWLMNKVTFHDN
ncbi:carbohydrate ABC transporter permease [Polymorphum gilvum]|uniref:Putative ABC transporter permease protein n=1 Tax=Polymorphum gilvum (strain LMG 25793 / CGMCC 1.9160 / SL003B-26A1) TaxID=991905 RepID=F2J1P7_POLGS|nr:sugar ABC transporter permease [Polymorphum gilvum]ADZ70848.1 Putative ABC transporter permease protein [Polymorphum gilvum SL003B-26A1]